MADTTDALVAELMVMFDEAMALAALYPTKDRVRKKHWLYDQFFTRIRDALSPTREAASPDPLDIRSQRSGAESNNG